MYSIRFGCSLSFDLGSLNQIMRDEGIDIRGQKLPIHRRTFDARACKFRERVAQINARHENLFFLHLFDERKIRLPSAVFHEGNFFEKISAPFLERNALGVEAFIRKAHQQSVEMKRRRIFQMIRLIPIVGTL